MKGKTKEKTTSKKVNSAEIEIAFQFDKETPGAVRFQELSAEGSQNEGQPLESMDEGMCGTLYVRKAGLKRLGLKDLPEGCIVTISFT